MRFTVLYNHNKFEYINNIKTTINNKIDKQMTKWITNPKLLKAFRYKYVPSYFVCCLRSHTDDS